MQKYIDICKSIAVVAGLHRSYNNNNNISRSKPEHLKRLQLNQMQKKQRRKNYKLKRLTFSIFT